MESEGLKRDVLKLANVSLECRSIRDPHPWPHSLQSGRHQLQEHLPLLAGADATPQARDAGAQRKPSRHPNQKNRASNSNSQTRKRRSSVRFPDAGNVES